MLDSAANPGLIAQLMEIVQDPRLRGDVEHLFGDFCHQCRNRLNSLKLSIYLAKRQSAQTSTDAWKSLESDYQILEDQFKRVQTICRPLGLSPVTIALNLLFDDRRASWSNIMAAAGRKLEFQQPCDGTVARFDVDQLGAALDAMVAWRAEQGASAARTMLCWWVEAQQACVTWTETESLGAGTPTRPTRKDLVWTLPILTRIVTEHGGTLQVDEQAGWTMKLTWPTRTN